MTIIDQEADGIMSIHHPLLHPLFPYVVILYILAALFFPAAVIKSAVYTGSNCLCMVTSESINEVTLRYAYYITWSSSWLTWWMLPLFHAPAQQQQQPQQQKTPKRAKERGQRVLCPINRFGEIISCWMFFFCHLGCVSLSRTVYSYISPPEKKRKNQNY